MGYLDIEMAHPKRPPSRLTYHSKRLWSGQTRRDASAHQTTTNQPKLPKETVQLSNSSK